MSSFEEDLNQWIESSYIPEEQANKLSTGTGAAVLKELARTPGAKVPSFDLFPVNNAQAEDFVPGFHAKPRTAKLGPLSGFVKSMFSAAGPEFFFLEPLAGVEDWRAERPGAGLVSQIAGDLVTYGAGAAVLPGVAAKLPLTAAKYTKALQYAAKADSAWSRAALQSALQIAPLEALRLGTGVGSAIATREPGKAGEQTKRVFMDMVVTGVAGGVIGGLAGLRKLPRLKIDGEELVQRTLGDYTIANSAQDKLQKLITAQISPRWSQLLPEERDAIQYVDRQLRSEILRQVPIRGTQAHVRTLEGGKAPKVLNDVMTPGQRSGSNTYILSHADDLEPAARNLGIPDDKTWQVVQNRLLPKLPPDWEAHSQFPRVVVANTDKGSESLVTNLGKLFSPIGDGMWIGREQDGAYVLGWRLKGRALAGAAAKTTLKSDLTRAATWAASPDPGLQAKGKAILAAAQGGTAPTTPIPKAGDVYAFLKTDSPAIFHPSAALYASAVLQHNWSLAAPPLTAALRNVPMARFIEELDQRILPATEVTGTVRSGPSATTRRLLGPFAQEAVTAKEVFGEVAKEITAPSTSRFVASPTTQRTFEIARRAYQEARASADDLMYGTPVTPRAGTNLLGDIIRQRHARQGGIKPVIDAAKAAAGDNGQAEFTAAWISGMSPKEAKALGFNPAVVKLLETANKLDLKVSGQTKAVADAIGHKFDPLPYHYGLSRTWRGTYRVRVLDDNGKVLGMGAGDSSPTAVKNAQAIVNAADSRGIKASFNPRDVFVHERYRDPELAREITSPHARRVGLALADKILRAKPKPLSTFRPRRGTRGFVGDIDPLSWEEIESQLLEHYHRMYTYQADTLLREVFLTKELKRLGAMGPEGFGEFPAMHKAMQRAMLLGRGEQTPFSAQQNRAADHLLGAALGGQSASKLVDGWNKFMFHMTLGSLDMGFPALNAVTFMQTVHPETALVLSAPRDVLAKYYGAGFVSGGKVGLKSMGYLDPLRFSWAAMRQLTHPDTEFLEAYRWAIRNSVPNPRFVEEVVGQSSTGIREAIKEQNWLGVMGAISTWLPGRTEEISRLHAFSNGYLIGKDFLELQGPKLYEFAKKFTERTMYNYHVMDRSAITTTPAGRLFGLFKTWTSHYLWNMGAYAKEGFQHNNWAPFVWLMGGTGAIAGAGGMPGYFVADRMSRILSDKSLMENMYAAFGDEDGSGSMADVMYYGAPALLGYTAGGRSDAPGADLVRDVGAYTSIASFKRAQAIGELYSTVVDRWAILGQHPSSDDKVWRAFLKAFAPRNLQRLITSAGERGMRSLNTGNLIYDGLNIVDKALYGGAGFMKVDMNRSLEVDAEVWKNNNKRRKVITTLGDALGSALAAGDHGAEHIILKHALENQVQDSVIRSGWRNYQNRTKPAAERRAGKSQENVELQRTVLGK